MKRLLLTVFLFVMLVPNIVNAESKYLYDVLKEEAESGGLAKEYTGEHHDSFTEEPTHKIYHWYAENDEEGNQVLEKNNVIFGGYCWQMIRTTDTGGVKMIYNGKEDNGKCLNSRNNHLGIATKKGNINLDSDYLYGKSFLYDEERRLFILTGDTETRKYQEEDYLNFIGLYTCGSMNTECEELYQIIKEKNTTGNVLIFSFNETIPYSMISKVPVNYPFLSPSFIGYMYNTIYPENDNYINTNECMVCDQNKDAIYWFGDSYTLNQDETISINNAKKITYWNWWSDNNYSNMNNKYVCKNSSPDNCTHLWYSTATNMNYFSHNNIYKYANGFTYSNGKYKLNNDNIIIDNLKNDSNLKKLDSHHYTCLDISSECNEIYYLYEYSGSYFSSITLRDGQSIEDAINKMFFEDNVNKKNSTIKSSIEAWFHNHLIDYDEFIEDAIYCNDRTIRSYGAWNPNGGPMSWNLYFTYNDTGDLKCNNVTDQFSIYNNKAKLDYKIGLATRPELYLLNNNMIRNVGENYWLLTPYGYYLTENYINQNGAIKNTNLYFSYGVRPVISLMPEIKYNAGIGEKNNPYIIDTRTNFIINVEMNNDTEDLTIEINDMTQVESEEEVTFKVTPIKGYKVTSLKIIDEDNHEIEYETIDNKNYSFIMPASNVTIIPSYERVSNSVIVEDNKNTKQFIIEVNDSKAVVYEDKVKFTITPEDGYEVEDVEIKDGKGNIVEYRKTDKENEYEFIMPDTDVMIHPIYKKIDNSLNNPKTGNRVFIILLIVISLGIGIIIFKKKIFRCKV
ncbi:MAG: hypothetical protein IJG68_07490 [Bacilli bacterium]|nr:hypothetical protein [Bacilli bacterium]